MRVALQVPEWRGLGVKEADKHIIAHLKAQGRIIKVGGVAGGWAGGRVWWGGHHLRLGEDGGRPLPPPEGEEEKEHEQRTGT